MKFNLLPLMATIPVVILSLAGTADAQSRWNTGVRQLAQNTTPVSSLTDALIQH
ncbi:hypothetical protein IQ266_04605 [filamentous cyanobacterium LEGE 11480]|uniref:Uncharacterized protein n=1 Tax=Romeriopsis navalis LEGE 11480 TaxID=2777977 RepID=A0A928Z177_9CYAN|nr:hypothetical protein [Romeriopsis navalis]MBE9029041.1 hypothetical protein [Romeriopsis navalis LEGE 11480]